MGVIFFLICETESKRNLVTGVGMRLFQATARVYTLLERPGYNAGIQVQILVDCLGPVAYQPLLVI